MNANVSIDDGCCAIKRTHTPARMSRRRFRIEHSDYAHFPGERSFKPGVDRRGGPLCLFVPPPSFASTPHNSLHRDRDRRPPPSQSFARILLPLSRGCFTLTLIRYETFRFHRNSSPTKPVISRFFSIAWNLH